MTQVIENSTKSGRGGKRTPGPDKKIGRPATKSLLPGGAAFADRVLARIPELVDNEKKQLYKDAEDFALHLLEASDIRVQKEMFLALIYQKFGKPVQPISSGDGEFVVRTIVEHRGTPYKPNAKA